MNKIILLIAIFIASADMIFDFNPWIMVVYTALCLISIKLKNTPQIHGLILIFLFKLFPFLNLTPFPTLNFWLPIIASTLLLLPFSSIQYRPLSWVKIGKIDRTTWVLVGITIPLSTAALVIWAYFADYLGFGEDLIRPLLSISPLILFGLIGPGFSILNACAEEFFFRGIIQESLNSIMTNQYYVITVQAIYFAAAHFKAGFPNGVIGFFMVLTWGAVIGYMRQRTAGLLASVITHVATDIVIFTTLGFLASTGSAP